jgi:magnesium transporter
MAGKLEDRQLLWIDVLGRDAPDLQAISTAVGLDDHLMERLGHERGRADLTQYPDHIHLILESIDAPDTPFDKDWALDPHEIDLVAGRNWVVTVHSKTVSGLARIDDLTAGETRFGALDAAGFLAAIVDEVIAGYLGLAEMIEREIDRLDDRALRRRPDDDILAQIVRLRRSIAAIRRTLTPHRLAFAALARPEMELQEELGRPWPGLIDNLNRAIDSIENLRDLLLGTYDIHMGRSAQQANEIMKRLTLLSAILLPAVVLAGIMGMNYQMPFFEDTNNFWLVVGVMVVFGVGLLGVSRWRGWL